MLRSKSRTMLAAFATVLALGAMVSASASAALPEFAPANAKETVKTSFTGSMGSASWKIGSSTFTCGTSSVAGEISAAKTLKGVTILFTSCKGGANNCPTGNKGEHEGEVKTEALEGTLVYISKTAKTVGIDFKAQSGTALAIFHCLTSNAEVRGSVVMPITSVNKLGSSFTLRSTEGSKEFENGAGEKQTTKLEADWPTAFQPMSWTFESALTTSKNLEIKA